MFVALYKTYRGGEWLKASLDSIRPAVDVIVFVHSRSEWGSGPILRNNCLVPAAEWARDNPGVPIVSIVGEYLDQHSQYQAGYELIRIMFNFCHLLLIDSDEVWDEADLSKLKNAMSAGRHAAYCCRLRTYVKSAFYRVEPAETCTPVVGLDMSKTEILGPRGMLIKDKVVLDDVWMHHFTYVRELEEDIRVKFRTSAIGDFVPGRDRWLEDVWPRIPSVRAFHPSQGYENSWGRIKKVCVKDLPAAMRQHPLVIRAEGNYV